LDWDKVVHTIHLLLWVLQATLKTAIVQTISIPTMEEEVIITNLLKQLTEWEGG